jgi:hypothetical protein
LDPKAQDPEAWLVRRRRMKVILARHCHIPPTYWEPLEVTELVAYFADFVEVLKLEKEAHADARP